MFGPVVILIYDIESGGFTLSVGYFFQGDRSLMYQIAMSANLRALLLSLGTLFLSGWVIATGDSQEMPGPMMGAGGSQQIQALKKEIEPADLNHAYARLRRAVSCHALRWRCRGLGGSGP
jgi:hypothetical protein